MSEVKGSVGECQVATAQEQPRGAIPHPSSGAVAGRTHPTSKARDRGREEPPRVRGQGRQPGGATPCPKPGEAARRSNPISKEWWLHGHRRA